MHVFKKSHDQVLKHELHLLIAVDTERAVNIYEDYGDPGQV